MERGPQVIFDLLLCIITAQKSMKSKILGLFSTLISTTNSFEALTQQFYHVSSINSETLKIIILFLVDKIVVKVVAKNIETVEV